MALKTLDNYPNKIDFKDLTFLKNNLSEFITVDKENGIVVFTIQNGPIKEVGKNGVQLDELFFMGRHMISELNKSFPCEHNVRACDSATEVLTALTERRIDRESRGVEGFNKA